MDANTIFEMKRIREELHSISTSLKRIANDLEEMKPKKEEVCEGEEVKKDETTI